MFLARPVFNLKAIEFGAFSPIFTNFSKNMSKYYIFDKLSDKKTV